VLVGCPKCGSARLRIKVSLFLDVPVMMSHRLSKTALRDKRVRVDGADWPRCLWYCERDGCGWSEYLG
jgi:hypothetical protein